MGEHVKGNKEAEVKKKKLKDTRQDVAEIKADCNKKSDELSGIKREIAEAQASAKSAFDREVALRAGVEEAKERAQEVTTAHGVMVEENRSLLAKLAEIQEQLAKWHAEKEEAVALHAKAQALLLRSPKAGG